MRKDQVNPCENGGHFTQIGDGRCVRCGEIVGRFNAMAAAAFLQQGKQVRQPHWPKGTRARLDERGIVVVEPPLAKTHATLQELLGPWELADEGNEKG